MDGLPAHKMHCSVLAEEAIKNAIIDYYRKHDLPVSEELLNYECAHGGEEE